MQVHMIVVHESSSGSSTGTTSEPCCTSSDGVPHPRKHIVQMARQTALPCHVPQHQADYPAPRAGPATCQGHCHVAPSPPHTLLFDLLLRDASLHPAALQQHHLPPAPQGHTASCVRIIAMLLATLLAYRTSYSESSLVHGMDRYHSRPIVRSERLSSIMGA
jgi:hypothetical protein